MAEKDAAARETAAAQEGLTGCAEVENDGGHPSAAGPEEAARKRKRFSKEGLQALKTSYDKRGICYIGYIPSGMKPWILKNMLSQYGEVTRVELQMEDARNWHKRKKDGGDRRKFFVEGWAEFSDKRVAKRTAEMLNGEAMGGKPRSPFYHELWCIKYLPKFKWEDLLEGIEHQKHIFQHRLQSELSEAKKDQEFYLTKVNQAHRMMKNNKGDEEGNQAVGGVENENVAGGEASEGADKKRRKKKKGVAKKTRFFEQTKPNPDPVEESDGEVAPDVMMLIAGSGSRIEK